MSEWVQWGWFFEYGYTNECHKTHNGWYLGLVAPISSIVWLLILYFDNKAIAIMAAYLEHLQILEWCYV